MHFELALHNKTINAISITKFLLVMRIWHNLNLKTFSLFNICFMNANYINTHKILRSLTASLHAADIHFQFPDTYVCCEDFSSHRHIFIKKGPYREIRHSLTVSKKRCEETTLRLLSEPWLPIQKQFPSLKKMPLTNNKVISVAEESLWGEEN